MSAFPVEPAFERAVVAQADDDTPRLVYADWLDENGDTPDPAGRAGSSPGAGSGAADRAAFIRAQCRLAELPPDDPEWCALDVQQDVLAHRLVPRLAELRPPLPQPYSHGTHAPHMVLKRHFRRGFPSLVFYHGLSSAPRPQLAVENLAELVANTTCRDVEFQYISPEWVNRLADAPAAAHLRGLSITLTGNWSLEANDARIAAFLKLAASPLAPHLQRLGIPWMPHNAQAAFAESHGFPGLRRLDAPGWAVSAVMLAAPWMRGLRHLCVSDSSTFFGDPAIAAAGELPDLHTLEVTARALPAVLAAARFPRLARFVKSNIPMLLRDFQVLLAAPWFAQLRSLDLSYCELGDRSVVALAKHPVARHLRDLRLGNNPFGKFGLSALSDPGAFPELVRLDVSGIYSGKRKATEADIAAFLARLAHPKLQSLHLTGQPVNDFGALVIAKNTNLSGLRELRLGSGVTDQGWKALRACEHLRQTAIV